MEVVKAYELSKLIIWNAKQNFLRAFIYNIIGIPVAAGMLIFFGGPTLESMFAAVAMVFSSIP
ncbi:MAG: hypothetical protein ACRC5Q_00210, partial [Culicoidibacterales bacterium]